MTLLATFALLLVTASSSFALDRLEEILAAMGKAGDSLETLAASGLCVIITMVCFLLRLRSRSNSNT